MARFIMVTGNPCPQAPLTTKLGAASGAWAICWALAAIRNWRPQSYYDAGRGTLSRDGGGVLLTQGIHTIDLLLNYAGTPAAISAFVRTTPIHRMETEDLVTAAFSFEGGAIGSLNATTCAYPGLPERIELIGTKGTAVLTGSRLDAAFVDDTREMAGGETIGSGAGANPMAFGHEMHRSLIGNFIDAIENGCQLRIKCDDALNAHRFIDAVLLAGTVVKQGPDLHRWPDPPSAASGAYERGRGEIVDSDVSGQSRNHGIEMRI